MTAGRKAKAGRKNCVIYTRMQRKICRKFSGQRASFWRYCCGFFLFPWFFVAGSGLARILALGPFHRHSTQRVGSGRAGDTGPGIRVWTFAKKRGCARTRQLEKRHNYARKQKKHRPYGRCLFADAGPAFWSEWRESNSRPLEPHSSALPNCATPGQSWAVSNQLVYYRPFCKKCQHLFCDF